MVCVWLVSDVYRERDGVCVWLVSDVLTHVNERDLAQLLDGRGWGFLFLTCINTNYTDDDKIRL